LQLLQVSPAWQLPSPQTAGLPEELLDEEEDELLLLELDDELLLDELDPPPVSPPPAELVVVGDVPVLTSPPEPPTPSPMMTAPWAQPKKPPRARSRSAAWSRKRRSTGTSRGERAGRASSGGTHRPGRT
jgi:hypothetical protein